MAASGVKPHWGWLELPLLVGYLITLSLGVSMLVSAWYVRYRDIKPIWDVMLQIIFYGSPVLYVMERVDVEWIKWVMLHLNPLAPLLVQVRHAIIDPNAPSAAAEMGGAVHLLVPIGLVAGIFALGLYVFAREAPRIAEDL